MRTKKRGFVMTKTQIAVLGLVAAIVVAVIIVFLPKEIGADIIAGLVAFLGGVYFGVGLKSDTNKRVFLNISMSAFFFVLFLLGIWVHFAFHAAAVFLHAVWDIVIDRHDHVKFWYMPICVSADIFLGFFILIWFVFY